MTIERFVLPGEELDPESLPSHPKLPLKLGPGLRHIPPNTITPTVAGQLCTDKRKNAVWVEFNGGRVCQIPPLAPQIKSLMKSPVCTHSRRPRNSHHPKRLRRCLLRQHQRLHLQRLPPQLILRGCHAKNTPATCFRCPALCASDAGK